jgi:hypothetical protein
MNRKYKIEAMVVKENIEAEMKIQSVCGSAREEK